jgi:integrase
MAINKTAAETYVVDWRDQAGRRFRKTFSTHREAIDYEKDMVAQVSRGDFIPPSKETVGERAEKWHNRKADAGSYRFATLQNWRTHIEKYIVPLLGELRIQEVSVEDVETAAAQWARMTSANTANKVLTTLTAIFKLAQRTGPLQQKANVAQLAERIKISNEEDKDEEVTPEEVYCQEELNTLILAMAPGSLERVLIMVAALCGLRIGEVLGLRTLNLPQELAHELKVWKLKCPPSEHDLVFATVEGKPLHRKGAAHILDQAIAAAEIKRLTLHKLRHTFASLLLARGVPIPKVSKLLGHRDSIITMKTYDHFVEDKRNDEQELATSILGGKL